MPFPPDPAELYVYGDRGELLRIDLTAGVPTIEMRRPSLWTGGAVIAAESFGFGLAPALTFESPDGGDGTAELLLLGGTSGGGQPPQIRLGQSASSDGYQLCVPNGAPYPCGQATLVAGTVTVTHDLIGPGTRVILSRETLGGTPGHLYVSARNPGTDFTIASTSAADTSEVNWLLIEPT